MDDVSRVVIVGAGLAGATAAQGLRERGFDGRIAVVGDEPHRPYERPPLSKEFLMGTTDEEGLYVHAADWYADHDVELRLNATVSALDRGTREAVLMTGARLPYDALLLATGSSPRRLGVPGADLDGVHYLRRLDDSVSLRAAFAKAGRVVMVGAGWIGLETAAAARDAGLHVTLLESGELPLLRVLGPEVAGIFADLHRANGVDLRTGVTVERLVGVDGSVTGVRLGDGTELPADLVVVGVGIAPNDSLARDAGLTVDNGVVVDERLCSSDPAVFAVGDVANAWHPLLGRRLRVEHWANARRQGSTVARTMLGQDVSYDRLPYFFSDQYDLGIEYTGYVHPGGYDRVVFRGSAEAGKFIVFWLASGRVLAGMNANVWDVSSAIEALVSSGAPVDADRLQDSSTPLDEIVDAPPA